MSSNGGGLDVAGMERAAQALLGAVVSGGSWQEPLESFLPVLGAFGGGLARVTPPDLFGLPSSGMIDVVDAIYARRAPPVTRLTRIDPSPLQGFVCDQMDAYRLARARDPFCQEFLRPMGVAYQASAFVDETSDGAVNFLLFRRAGSGGFDPADLATFSLALPYLRAAAMTSRAALARNADEAAAPFRRRGDPVLALSHAGRVLDGPREAIDLLGPDVVVAAGRLRARYAMDQRRIDQALTSALADRRPGLVTLSTPARASSLRLLFVPVLGRALDVFRATAALMVVLDVSRRVPIDEDAMRLLASSTGLTPRETEVARLVAAGHGPREAAARLGIGYDTARLHLKAVYAKADIHGQWDLTALLHRFTAR